MFVVVFLFVLQIKLYEIASIFRHPAIMNEFTVSLFNQSAAGDGIIAAKLGPKVLRADLSSVCTWFCTWFFTWFCTWHLVGHLHLCNIRDSLQNTAEWWLPRVLIWALFTFFPNPCGLGQSVLKMRRRSALVHLKLSNGGIIASFGHWNRAESGQGGQLDKASICQIC